MSDKAENVKTVVSILIAILYFIGNVAIIGLIGMQVTHPGLGYSALFSLTFLMALLSTIWSINFWKNDTIDMNFFPVAYLVYFGLLITLELVITQYAWTAIILWLVLFWIIREFIAWYNKD